MGDILVAICMGILQGVSEWLPVSSTGHMLLLDRYLSLPLSPAFRELFFVLIQLGSIAAVPVLFWERLWPFSRRKTPHQRRLTWKMWGRVLLAVLPCAVAGVLFGEAIERRLYHPVPIAVALIVYGIFFLLIERLPRRAEPIADAADVPLPRALCMGLGQVLALIPGTSRSGATMLCGLLAGLSRTAAAELSFLMALPTMAGAGGLKLIGFWREGVSASPREWLILIVATLTAFLVSLLVIRALLDFVKRHSFAAFGVYRIALGLLVLLAAWKQLI